MVQRVPVRIALDAEQLKTNPLRIGLSMDVEVDISNKDGKMLADAPRATALTQTQVYSQLDRGADAEVDRIVAANLGNSAAAKAVHVPSVPSPRPAPAMSPSSAAQIAPQGQPG